MNGTVADAQEYWRRYYAEQFQAGQGTEDALATLMQIPPLGTWVDYGSGSESLLWAIALRARRLIAVDIDPYRLDILRQFAAAARPRGVHTTALRLCGRPEPDAFTRRCRSLAGLVLADCLAGPVRAELTYEDVELVTQFGLLGLCSDTGHFTDQFAELHRPLLAGGWCAGANWVARDPTGRVDLTAALYQHAAHQAGISILLLHRVAQRRPRLPRCMDLCRKENHIVTAPATHPSDQQEPRVPELIFAPVGIAHLTDDNVDLLRAAARGTQRLRVTTAAQLNGTPHIGTVVTLLSVFALTTRAADRLGLPATVVFDALDNAPAEQITINGAIYTRTVGDLIDSGHVDREARVSGFERLLDWASARADIRYEFRPYDVYQALPPVRECLHSIASHLDDFRPIVAPADGIVRIRPRCPTCRLMEKSGTSLRITAGDGVVHLDSRCPHHGTYRETIDIHGTTGWYDANTPIRSIQKGFLLSAERDLYHACSVSIDGADWGGAWHAHVLASALATLGIPVADWPVSLFTPLVLDRSGGKLSKSLYVRYGPDYADLPEAFLNLDLLLDQHGDHALDALWTEITQWAAEPRRLHRNYTVDYLADLLRARQRVPVRRAL